MEPQAHAPPPASRDALTLLAAGLSLRPADEQHWHYLRLIAFRMSRGVSVTSRKKRTRFFENVWIGEDLINWMMADSENPAETPEEAVRLGQQLMDHGFLARVSTSNDWVRARYGREFQKREFKGKQNSFYRFNLELVVPYNLHVVVAAARGLNKTDRMGLSDPYVKLQVGNTLKTSSIIMKTLNPVWRDESYVFGVVDPMSEHLKINVMDYDTWSSDDPLGSCELSLGRVPVVPHLDDLKSLLSIWRSMEEDDLGNDTIVGPPGVDQGWVNLKLRNSVVGQIRVAMVLRDYHGRKAERFKSTRQPYTLKMRCYSIDEVLEKGANIDMWLGTKLGIHYNAKVRAIHEHERVETPWVRKNHDGSAEFREDRDAEEVGVDLSMPIEANLTTDHVKLVVMQKLPTDQDVTAHPLAAIKVPLGQLPLFTVSDSEASILKTPNAPPPVEPCRFRLTDGAKNNFMLDVQNGHLKAAVWLEMGSNGVLGPMVEEKLAAKQYVSPARLHHSCLDREVKVGLERLYRAVVAPDAILFSVFYDEMLYTKVKLEAWEFREAPPPAVGQELQRRAFYTVAGLGRWGTSRVFETHRILRKEPGGFALYIEATYPHDPFGDKRMEKTLIVVQQHPSDAYTCRVRVSNEMDLNIGTGVPVELRKGFIKSANARALRGFAKFANIIDGAALGSNENRDEQEKAAVAAPSSPARYRRLGLLLLLLLLFCAAFGALRRGNTVEDVLLAAKALLVRILESLLRTLQARGAGEDPAR